MSKPQKDMAQIKATIIKDVKDYAKKSVKGKDISALGEFIEAFYRYSPLEEIENQPVADLCGAALSLWRFSGDYKGDDALVRLFNPKPEIHGWHSGHSVLEVVQQDMPFLVDSVCQLLTEKGFALHRLVHPTYDMKFDKASKSDTTCSLMHIEIDRISDAKLIKSIESDIRATLEDVEHAVADWGKMTEQARKVAKDSATSTKDENGKEAQSFLQWLIDNHFTFLGYRQVDFHEGKGDKWRINEDSCMGILRDVQRRIFNDQASLDQLGTAVQSDYPHDDCLIFKASSKSRVHRRAHLDVVLVKIYGKGKKSGERQVIGAHIFAGLFTSSAYSQSVYGIPLLRQKLKRVAARIGYAPSGHDTQALNHVLETYPRDELFQIDEERLAYNAAFIVRLGKRPEPHLFLRQDPLERHITALVYLPRDRFSSQLRHAVGAMLERSVGGRLAAYYTQMGEGTLAQVLYIFATTPGQIPAYDDDEINDELEDICRNWTDHLRQGLQDRHGEEDGNNIWRIYSKGFSLGYQETTSIPVAIHDIEELEKLRLDEQSTLRVNLHQPIEMAQHQLRLKLYMQSDKIVLSHIIPILENMGLTVIEENPYEVNIEINKTGLGETQEIAFHIHDFGLETSGQRSIDIDSVRDLFHDALVRIWQGGVENDGFNRLVLQAELDWRRVMMIRAYAKYLQQASIPFSQDYMQRTFDNNAPITRDLAELFMTRFDPDLSEEARKKHEAELNESINEALENVQILDEDRILRRFLNLIHTTLRTNFFQKDAMDDYKSHVSFKFDTKAIEDLPEPKPLREIYVYSPRFEAVHLRFGFVARGGLRWSDRREDFRTEILGLVKAQQVKNAVIVPVGSKGGFVLKRAAGLARPEFMKEGIACYKQFIAAMLEITDNLKQGDLIPPEGVVRHDNDDPYLVVAADKGTATFSDFANEVSVNHGFWLGDAFASGGSAGYDHKIMGITARGAWEAVKRHFRERGVNTQEEDFTVIGVGDMGGDVFGNGMLLSKHIRLQAAFNHLHIFIDPNPDAPSSYQERERLFKDVKGWADYNKSLISKGGGIFERAQKSIALTPEIKAMLDIEEDSLAPNELIRRILLMQVDLLWFGGIGTYIKHSSETHADAGDRANDAIRVNGNALQCKVIGEGANLGTTHLGRIEFAMNGGSINTDAIDNSAGVDCSDHEVNIKILLGDIVEGGDLTEKQRNKLLASMTDEVAALVLRDNYQQTQSLSVCQQVAVNHIDRHQRVIRAMERAGHLNRALEFIPDDETINERAQKKQGLVRPELSVLLAYAKNITYQEILESNLPDDEWLKNELQLYFPTPLQEQYHDEITHHKLKREIIATTITNSMINRAGLDFVNETARHSGADHAAIARAYLVVREVFGLREIWKHIETGDGKIPAQHQHRMLYETRRTIERLATWFLRHHNDLTDVKSLVERYTPGVREFSDHLVDVLPDEMGGELQNRIASFKMEHVSDRLAKAVGELKILSTACDLVRLQDLNPSWSITNIGQCYVNIGQRFMLDSLRTSANHLQSSQGSWNRLALSAVIDDLWSLQFNLTKKVTQTAESCENATVILNQWLKENEARTGRIDQLLNDLANLSSLDLAMLSVATRELRTLTDE